MCINTNVLIKTSSANIINQDKWCPTVVQTEGWTALATTNPSHSLPHRSKSDRMLGPLCSLMAMIVMQTGQYQSAVFWV